jgi:hypothetical protein
MNATRARGVVLILLVLSWSARAQVVPPATPAEVESPPVQDAPPSTPPASESPPIQVVPPPDPTELDRAPTQDAPLADPADVYDEQFIRFDDFGSVVTDHGRVTGTVQWTVPYEGKYKRPLTGTDFYRKLGRADLVKAYQDRETLRGCLMVAVSRIAEP